MAVTPLATIRRMFICEDASGAPVNADETPTAVLRRNGNVCLNANISVSSTGTTGEYVVQATFAAEDGWQEGDSYALPAAAIIAGVTYRRVVAQGQVSDVPNLVAAIRERTDRLPDDPASAQDVAAVAGSILSYPDHKLLTDPYGRVAVAENADKENYRLSLSALAEVAETLEADGRLLPMIAERTQSLPDDPASDTTVTAAADALTAAIADVGERTQHIPDDPASVTDITEMRNAILDAVAILGYGGNPVRVTVQSQGAPVAGMAVSVWNSDMTANIAWGFTNSEGIVTFYLDGAESPGKRVWIGLLSRPDYMPVEPYEYFVTNTGYQEVPTFTLQVRTPTPPHLPGVVQVSGYTYHNGQPVSGCRVQARLIRESAIPDILLSRMVTETISDDAGYWALTLVTADQFTKGDGVYEFVVYEANSNRAMYRVQSAIPAGLDAYSLVDAPWSAPAEE